MFTTNFKIIENTFIEGSTNACILVFNYMRVAIISIILTLVFLVPLGVFSQEQKINTSKEFRFEDFNITLKVLIVSVEELEILEIFGEILSFDGETAILKTKRDKAVELSKLGFKIKELSKRVTYKKELITIHLSSKNSSDRTSITKMIAKVSNSTVTSYLQDLQDFRTRHSYTNNSTLAAEYIANMFNKTELEVEYDFFIYNNYSMKNVIATIPGSSKNSSIFIISAHYDSLSPQWESIAPGADDDASGVAALIEAARILSEYDFNSTLKFIAFSGEEQGLLGSKHYAEEAFYSNESIVGVINFDMIGYNDNFSKIDLIGNPESEWLVDLMNSTNSEYNLGIMINKIIDPNIWYSDHSSFWDNGYNAILGIEDIRPWDSNPFYKANPYYHTIEDTFDKLNLTLILKTTKMGVATLAELADPLQPDFTLSPSDIQFSNNDPIVGENVVINAKIHNNGETDAITEVELIIDGISIGNNTISVTPNSTNSIQFNWSAIIGTHKIAIVIDPENKVIELNESNNYAIIELNTIAPCKITGDFNKNCKVEMEDATLVAYMVIGKEKEDLEADFNKNGRIDIGDAAKIAYYVAGKISEL